MLIEKKAKAFLNAEKAYWEQRQLLIHQHSELSRDLSLDSESLLTPDLSSTVWALKDGVAFVRHKPIKGQVGVFFRSLPWTLEQWSSDGPILPLDEGEISIGKTGFKVGLANATFVNCQINDLTIPYAEFAWLKYGDSENQVTIERAILDFHLTILGVQFQQDRSTSGQATSEATISRLDKIAEDFELLLDQELKEEQLQQFLKDHPFLLHPAAEAIPKKKLGEDFITDFVLVASTAQGPTYFLVELERATHSVLTKELTLASPVNHAIKQTRDWDVWLEKNKAYLQGKLPGFETPQYIIIIGRGHDFDEEQKMYLRSYNREWKNLKLLTYDDVLIRFRGMIARLKDVNLSNTKTESD